MSGNQQAGWHRITWDGSDDKGLAVASGIYLYKVKYEYDAGDPTILLRQMLLIR